MTSIDEIQEFMETMRVRSESSKKRMSNRIKSNPSHFLHVVPVGIACAAEPNQQSEDEDDSTYEASDESEDSDSSEICSNIVFDKVWKMKNWLRNVFPFQLWLILTMDILIHGSDDGQGPDDDEMNKEKLPRRQVFINRGITMAQHLGLSTFWITKIAKFSKVENRWVNKGPVLVYFANEHHPRLMGNFIYGTKSVCLDLQCIFHIYLVFEHFDVFMKHYNNNRCQFSTFGHQATRHCETCTEKIALGEFFPTIPDDGQPVYKCISKVHSVQEPESTIFTIKFLNHDEHVQFANSLKQVMVTVQQNYLRKRFESFQQPVMSRFGSHTCIYASATEFVMQVCLCS
jgi:hypothetical protein